MSISKDLLPKKNPEKVISLKPEPKAGKAKKSGKVAALVETTEAFSEPVRGKTLKSRKFLQEQAEYQTRIDAELSQIPIILADLRETRSSIQNDILNLKDDQKQSSERIFEELKWLKETGDNAVKRVSRLLQIAVGAMIILFIVGIYLIYDVKVSSQVLLQKISGIESAVNQSEMKKELRETRNTLSDELRANQQSLTENKKVIQSVVKEIQKLNKSIGRLQEIETFNHD